MPALTIDINDISETALLMVILHAQDALTSDPILGDDSSVRVLRLIQEAQLKTSPQFTRIIKKGKLEGVLATYINLRAKYYDDAVRDWLIKYPEATIVNIGCGLDDRFNRVDNGEMTFLEIDFPDIIDIKKHLFPPSDRYIQIAQSVFDTSWMSQIKNHPVLLLAEGVFMYCEEEDVKYLFSEIQATLPEAELVCELYARKYVKPWLMEISYQLQRFRYGMGRDASFSFGASSGAELAEWDDGIEHLSDWTFLESGYRKLGMLNALRHVSWFSKNIWTSRYRFNPT